MSQSDPPFSADSERLRQEASAWLARMQRPDADMFKRELDAWLAADPGHLAAYNRVTERFNNAKILSTSTRYAATEGPKSRTKGRMLVPLAAACITMAIASLMLSRAYWSPMGNPGSESSAVASRDTRNNAGQRYLVSGHGQIRSFRLVDGSLITLDTDSRLRVAYDGQARHLWLEQGRGRFSVAHEARPFTVYAGAGAVTARGTVFDVAVDQEKAVHVALLKGVIDVAMPTPAHGSEAAPTIRQLSQGQQIAFGGAVPLPIAMPLVKTEVSWPDGMIEFEAAPLGDIVAHANRYAARPIRFGEPGLDQLKASGRFRINDPERLADNLAGLLDLTVDKGDPSRIVLHAR